MYKVQQTMKVMGKANLELMFSKSLNAVPESAQGTRGDQFKTDADQSIYQ